MTLAGKILVVLNLLLSFLFVGFAIMASTSRVDLRTAIRDRQAVLGEVEKQKNDLASKITKLEEALRKEQSELKAVVKKNTDVANDLQSIFEAQSRELAAIRADFDKTTEDLRVAHADQKEKRAEVDRLTGEHAKLTARLVDLEQKKFDLRNDLAQATIFLDQTQTRERQLAELVKQAESQKGSKQ